MKKCYWGLILSISIIATLETVAQAERTRQTLTLERLVETVTDNNPETQIYEAEISKAKAGVINAQNRANPELEIILGRKESSASGVNQGQGIAWEVGYAQTFEYPGRLKLREAIAKKQVTFAEIQLARFKLALTNKTKNIALDLYQTQQNQVTAQSIAEKVQRLVDVLSERESAGPALALDRKLIEGSAISFRQRAIQFAGEAEKLLAELNALGGSNTTAEYQIEIPHFGKPPVIPNASAIETLALENNPDVLLKKAELSQQGSKIQLSENEQHPSFTIRPFYSEEDAGDIERTFGIGFSVPLPIYNDNTGNIAIEQAQATQMEAGRKHLEQEIRGRIASLYASYKLQSAQLSALGPKSINYLRTAAEEAKKQYELGVVPAATYLQLQEQYLNNLILFRASQVQLFKDVAELEQIAGQNISAEQRQ